VKTACHKEQPVYCWATPNYYAAASRCVSACWQWPVGVALREIDLIIMQTELNIRRNFSLRRWEK